MYATDLAHVNEPDARSRTLNRVVKIFCKFFVILSLFLAGPHYLSYAGLTMTKLSKVAQPNFKTWQMTHQFFN